jgi:hypothetical protein
MTMFGEVQTAAPSVAARYRIGLCVNDPELRGWLVDELALMTGVGELSVETAEAPPGWDGLGVVIVEVDALSIEQLEHVRRIGAQTPVIAVTTKPIPAGIVFARVLSARLTSRDLEQAVRSCLMSTR